MIDAVVKVGGSLGRGTCLPELGERLVELGRRYGLLVVPGGGVFADAVREQDQKFGLRPAPRTGWPFSPWINMAICSLT